MKENKLYLVYVEKINDIPNSKGLFEYEFFFSETPEIVWGNDWNQQCPSACSKEDLRPDASTYNDVRKIYSIIPLISISENSCFSIQDSVDQIVAICWEDISEYETYPEPIRLVFNYGETFESVEDKLAQRHQFFAPKNNEEENEEI